MTSPPAPTPRKKSRGRQAASAQSARFGGFLLAVGAAILLLGAWGAVQGARTLGWPRAEATIISSDLRRFEGSERRFASGDYYRDHWYAFYAHYTYEVGGIEYVGGQIEPYDFGMQNSAGAQKMMDRHPIGSKAQIAYNPDDPHVAYLEPGPSSFSLILVAIGFIFGLVGLWLRGLARRGAVAVEGGGAPS